MRVESMVAQQAVVASARQSAKGSRADRAAGVPGPTSHPMSATHLPSAVADRLADFFASDPGFAAAVSAHMPAARAASARDMAAYGRPNLVSNPPRLIDVTG